MLINVLNSCCGKTGETVSLYVSECSKLAQRKYKRRHGNVVARMLQWKLCKKLNLEKSEKWYLHNPQTALKMSATNYGTWINNVTVSLWKGNQILFSIKWKRQKDSNNCRCRNTWAQENNRLGKGEDWKVSEFQKRFKDFGTLISLTWYLWSWGLLEVFRRTLRNM